MPGDLEREEQPKASRPESENFISHHEQSPFHEHPQLSASEIAESNAKSLVNEVNELRKGNAHSSESVLQEIHEMQRGNYLPQMAKDLEQSGAAKVEYGKTGEVEHIIFNDTKGSAPVDVDVKGDSINGKSAAQIRETSAQQSKDYYAATMADAKVTDESGKPLSPEAQQKANKLVGALLDGNVDAFTKAGQEIMKNPGMAKSIQAVLDRVNFPSPVSFGTDDKGQPFMQTREGMGASVIVSANGEAQAVNNDAWGNPVFGQSADLSKTMKETSDQALYSSSSAIGSAEGYLNQVDRLPKDGYTNMASLEHEYRGPDVGDNAILLGKLVRDIAKLTPAERAQVLRQSRYLDE